ncbi:MAG: methyltransferase domain-containing protein [Legionellaceae bacterium]|nr:methyltransferase domain-containing protein [Legionellaceae bacterium]
MKNKIELLDVQLLQDRKKLKELTYWLRVMKRPNGWHYDLDHIWILDELEKKGIQPGSTIVDAGAGQGVMQYLLAARGYNVISLDFSPRTQPARSRGIFDVRGDGDVDIAYQHPYMKFITYKTDWLSNLTKRLTLRNFKKLPTFPGRFYRYSLSYVTFLREKFLGQHENYGSITYVRAPFHDVPLEEGIADAVISVSAIEHADIDLFDKNIKSLSRLLKSGAPLLLTTSATSEEDNTYDQQVEGWCFSRTALASYFPSSLIDFEVAAYTRSLLGSSILMQRLDPYYYLNPKSPFYKKRFKTLPYLPVAIQLIR